MRSVIEVEDRIRTLLCAELDRRVAEAGRRLPRLCSHNHRQPLDTRKVVEDAPNDTYNRIVGQLGLPVVQTIGLCMLGSSDPSEWSGTICEDEIDARRCPYFDPIRKKQEIWDEMVVQIQDMTWVEANMPAVAALYWVLGTERANVGLPWWRKVLYRLLRIRIEPVLPPLDAERLLLPVNTGSNPDPSA